MSSEDIVERLRDLFYHDQIEWEAADEIERLRAAGDALAQALSDYGYGGDWEVLKAWEEARRER